MFFRQSGNSSEFVSAPLLQKNLTSWNKNTSSIAFVNLIGFLNVSTSRTETWITRAKAKVKVTVKKSAGTFVLKVNAKKLLGEDNIAYKSLNFQEWIVVEILCVWTNLEVKLINYGKLKVKTWDDWILWLKTGTFVKIKILHICSLQKGSILKTRKMQTLKVLHSEMSQDVFFECKIWFKNWFLRKILYFSPHMR